MTLHTTLEKIENAAVRPTVHTNPSRKRSLFKRSSNRRNLKALAFRSRVDGTILEMEFSESDDVMIIT